MNKSWVANLFTGANIVFGSISIILSLSGEFQAAAWSIVCAMVSDALDGRVARALGTAGPMGVELDSLCDNTSFGVAPGILLYSYQLHELGWVGAVPAVLLGLFCTFRLARFNVHTSVVHGYFEGLPCPTVGVVVASYILSGAAMWPWLLAVCTLLLGILMVTEIHYPDNKGKSADQLHWQALLAAVVFLVLCVVLYWPSWAVALCTAYILFGILNTWMNRRKKLRQLRNRRLRSRISKGA